MSIARIAIVCAFAGALTAGAVHSAGAVPLAANVKAMKSVAQENIVQVQWRRGWGGGWRGGGWGVRRGWGGGWGVRRGWAGGWGVRRGWAGGWGVRRGWGGWGWGGPALAGAVIGGAIASSAWDGGWGSSWGDPYGYYDDAYYGYPAYGWAPRPFYGPRFVSYGYVGRPFRPVWGYRYGWRRWGW
jgi:hypothetical protein